MRAYGLVVEDLPPVPRRARVQGSAPHPQGRLRRAVPYSDGKGWVCSSVKMDPPLRPEPILTCSATS